MAKFDTKVTGNQVAPDEYNNIVVGVKNVITSSDQTIDTSNTQITKGIADYAAVGTFYTDSGAANAYVLSSIGSRLAPNAYAEGMEIRFRAGNSNTGASTVNVAGLGLKNIKKADGSTDIESGDISTDYDTRARYDGTVFRLSSFSDVNNFTVNGKFNTSGSAQTISSGAITYNQLVCNLRGEGNLDDTLTTINGGTAGDIIILGMGGSEDITIDSGAGNIIMRNNIDRHLTSAGDKMTLYYDGTNWTALAIESTQDFLFSSASNGYQYLPSGYIMQYGVVSVGANSTVTVTLPIAYNYNNRGAYGSLNTLVDRGEPAQAVVLSLSQIQVRNSNPGTDSIRWWSIGY